MSTHDYYLNIPGQGVPYNVNEDTSTQFYDGTSERSSTSSPSNQNAGEGSSRTGRRGSSYRTSQTYICHLPSNDPYQLQGAVPIELEIENLYEDLDRRRKRNVDDKATPSPVHSRRRAQNRASQRAFRDRKEKHVKEVEQRLREMEGKYSELSQSYEALQNEYTSLKQELEKLTQDDKRSDDLSSTHSLQDLSYQSTYHLPKEADFDYSLFDETLFSFEADAADMVSSMGH